MKSILKINRRLIIFFILFLLAITRIYMFEQSVKKDTKNIKNWETKNVTCKIVSLPSPATGGVSFFAEVQKGINVDSRVYVKIRNLSPKDIFVGDSFKAKVKTILPEGPLNKGGYDFKGYLKSRGASVVLSCDALDFKITKKGLLRPLYALRTKVSEEIFLSFDHDEAALINALVTGSKDEMSSIQKENFRKAGVYHIIAVSGLHLGLLLMFLLALFSGIKLKSTAKNLVNLGITFIGGMLLLVFTGFGISVQRAAFMALFLCAANFTSRDYSPMAALMYVLILVIITSPSSYLDPSCQLSFGATFGIVAALPLFNKIPFKSKGIKLVAESVIISVSSSLATLPFIVYHFGSVSLIAVISNLIILIIVPTLLLLSYIFSVSAIFLPWFASGVISHMLGSVSKSVNVITELMAAVPYGYVPLTLSALIVISLEVLGLTVVRKLKSKRFMYILAAVFVVANLGFISYNIFEDKVTVSFLNVGQGDCTLIHSKDGSTFMVDCGSESNYSIGSGEIKPHLERMGISKIDVVFLTHYHTDHISGLEYLIESGTVKTLVLPERDAQKDEEVNAERILKIALKAGTNVKYASSGDTITFRDKHEFEVIHPVANLSCDANNSSMVLYYKYGDSKILFMGDTESRGHRLLAEKLTDCDIIKLSHHGSKSTMSKSIYKLASPEYAVISCGADNKYGHPSEDTLKAFEKCKILRTDIGQDAIVFTLKDGKIKEN